METQLLPEKEELLRSCICQSFATSSKGSNFLSYKEEAVNIPNLSSVKIVFVQYQDRFPSELKHF